MLTGMRTPPPSGSRAQTERAAHHSGQVIVILALAMIGLLGLTAIALDGGMLLQERRRAFNAADSSSMAALYARVQGSNWKSTGLARAADNGFGTTTTACTPAGADCVLGTNPRWQVQIETPPRSGAHAGDGNYLRTTITTEVTSTLAHLVFSGPLVTTIEATARLHPAEVITPGYAVHANNSTACKALWFTGTGDAIIQGGSVFSNSSASSNNCQSGVRDGGGVVDVSPAGESIVVVGLFDNSGGSGSVSPPPVEGASQVTLRQVPPPDCSSLTDYGTVQVNAGQTANLSPGRYDRIRFQAGGTVNLSPGKYCIYGPGGFTGLGGAVNGSDVMIYLENGPLDLGGNSTVNLSAEDDPGVLIEPPPSVFDWKGMLFFLDPSNGQNVKITGGSGSVYTGTIYAPASQCVIEGTGSTLGLNSQVICDTVKIAGTADLIVNYVEDDQFHFPVAIELAD